MSLLDDIKNKAEDSGMAQKAEDFAKEHNISVEEAKNRLLNKDDK